MNLIVGLPSQSSPSQRVSNWSDPFASCPISEAVSGEAHRLGPLHLVLHLSVSRELNTKVGDKR